MHNIDRNQLEMGWETGDFEYETDQEAYDEMYDEYGEYDEYGAYGEVDGPFTEAEEMELAAELLSVSSEEELDQFLGGLFKKVTRGLGKVMKTPLGRQLGGVVKGLAKKVLPAALPIAGAALGSVVPGLGTALGGMAGGALSNLAGSVFGMELEGMSPEDQEFEIARRFVRFAGDAAQEAASFPANVPPKKAVQAAVTLAAQKHAPGLVNGAIAPKKPGQSKRSGRWVKRGKAIILFGMYD